MSWAISSEGALLYQEWYWERRYARQDPLENEFYTPERILFFMTSPEITTFYFYPKVYREARALFGQELKPRDVHMDHWRGAFRAWVQEHYQTLDDEPTDTYVFAETRRHEPDWTARLVRAAAVWEYRFPAYLVDFCTQSTLLDLYDHYVDSEVPECIADSITEDDAFARRLARRLMRTNAGETVPGHLVISNRLAREFAEEFMSLTLWQTYVLDIDPICTTQLPAAFFWNRSKPPGKTWWVSAKYSMVVLSDGQREFTCTLREALSLMFPSAPAARVCMDDDVVDALLIRAFKHHRRLAETKIEINNVRKEKVMERVEALERRGFLEKEGDTWVYVP